MDVRKKRKRGREARREGESGGAVLHETAREEKESLVHAVTLSPTREQRGT